MSQKMKYITTFLLIVFSASVLNARSIKITIVDRSLPSKDNAGEIKYHEKHNLLDIEVIDSKTKDKKTIELLVDSMLINVSKNKDALQKISSFLNEIQGGKNIYPWDKKDKVIIFDIINVYENSFIYGNYQVSKEPDERIMGENYYIFYFYKQD